MTSKPEYEELAAAIAHCLYERMLLPEPCIRSDGATVERMMVDNECSSGRQIPTGVLNRLGILQPLDGQQRRNEFSVPPEKFRERIGQNVATAVATKRSSWPSSACMRATRRTKTSSIAWCVLKCANGLTGESGGLARKRTTMSFIETGRGFWISDFAHVVLAQICHKPKRADPDSGGFLRVAEEPPPVAGRARTECRRIKSIGLLWSRRLRKMKEKKRRTSARAKAPERDKEQSESYQRTWGTAIGQDCINLNETLAAWLGERLIFLGDHTLTVKSDWTEDWRDALRRHGRALKEYPKKRNEGGPDDGLAEAKEAMAWVAKHFESLWD